jgi:hypothetical protein
MTGVVRLASPEGCWKLAGGNIPGNRSTVSLRPGLPRRSAAKSGGALEQSAYFANTIAYIRRRHLTGFALQFPFKSNGKIKISLPQIALQKIKPNIGQYSVFRTPRGAPLIIAVPHDRDTSQTIAITAFSSTKNSKLNTQN